MMFESSTIISLKDFLPLSLITFALAEFMSASAKIWKSGHRRAASGCFRGRQDDLEPGELTRVGAHTDFSAERVDAAGHDVHADSTASIHGNLFLSRKTGSENQGHRCPRIH